MGQAGEEAEAEEQETAWAGVAQGLGQGHAATEEAMQQGPAGVQRRQWLLGLVPG